MGQDADQGEDGFTTIILGEEDERDEGGDPGPATLAELAAQVRGTQRYDGVSVRIGGARGNAFRDDDYRISGQAETSIPGHALVEAVHDPRRLRPGGGGARERGAQHRGERVG